MSKTETLKTSMLSQKEIIGELAPYSENAVLQFLQKIWRWWLSVWAYFADKKPRLSKFLYTFALFYLFSNLVTIFQGVLLNIIPSWFGMELAEQAFAWPGTLYHIFGEDLQFIIFGYGVETNNLGQVIIGGGLGYFYSFMIATFLAQCINFPLQRNFTYRSKGNPWYQAMWYLIGWLGINVVIWIIIGNLAEWNRAFIGMPPAALSWVNIIIQGGVAMLIFFFIFRVIFPDVHKLADTKEAHLQTKKAALEQALKTRDGVKIEAATLAYEKAKEEALNMRKMSNVKLAEKTIRSINSTCESKIIKVISLQKHLDKLKEKNADQKEIQKSEEHLSTAIKVASSAISERDQIVKENELIISENA